MKNSIISTIFVLVLSLIFVACGGSESGGSGGSEWGGSGGNGSSEETDSPGIYGIVTDYATGRPVQNANVQLRPSGETTLTGADGMFEFRDLTPGGYSITVSKVEYSDLVDDQVITVRDRMVRYDLRIKKVMEDVVNLDILDNDGNPITELNFGSDSDIISKQFQIYNAGPVTIACSVVYKADWISEVSASYVQVESGDASPVVVTIDRSKLAAGENRTAMQITSNNGNKSLQLIATKGAETPAVKTLPVTDSQGRTDTSFRNVFHAEVTAVGNPEYTERGFCYSSESQVPDEYDTCKYVGGSGLGEYEYTEFNLGYDVKRWYVRAYLKWKGDYIFGNVETFVWNDVVR